MINKSKELLKNRPATLIGRFAETMPEADIRPIRENAAVREEAAANVYPLIEAAWPGADPARLREAFVSAVRWDSNFDVITQKMIAKLKCEPGASFRDALAQFNHEVELCHELMVKAWVRLRNITPRFSEGDVVVASIRHGLFEVSTVSGKVTEIDRDLATYTIMVKGAGKNEFYTVPFESAAGRDEPVQKTKSPLEFLTEE